MSFFCLPDGTRIYYDDMGDGPAMLLLHAGWGRYVNWFYSQMEAFPDQRLVIPDRRGYGRSTPVDHLPTDYHRHNAGDMLALLDGLSIDETILWGHSDGAVIAAWMALKAPDRVRALSWRGRTCGGASRGRWRPSGRGSAIPRTISKSGLSSAYERATGHAGGR